MGGGRYATSSCAGKLCTSEYYDFAGGIYNNKLKLPTPKRCIEP